MFVNLILALFWLVVSIGLFLYPLVREGAHVTILNTGIPAAWMTLFLFCYNMVRWWMVRVQIRERKVMDQPASRTRPRVEERNPDFDFSEGSEKKDV